MRTPSFRETFFSVEIDMKSNIFKCICSKFERDGMLCCHVLRLFTQFGVNEIPEHYILKRWTKKFREEELERCTHSCTENTGSDGSQNAMWHAMLMNKLVDITATVCKDGTKTARFWDELDRLQERIAREVDGQA
uniref:Protein FAR1-RELATED SEQUENCE n=1 Tax=Arundo donax TaxID=35708 RepID=A0A0A9D1K4_ARUDO